MEGQHPRALSLEAQFQLHRHHQMVDETTEIQPLRNLAKLAMTWQATTHAMLKESLLQTLPQRSEGKVRG